MDKPVELGMTNELNPCDIRNVYEELILPKLRSLILSMDSSSSLDAFPLHSSASPPEVERGGGPSVRGGGDDDSSSIFHENLDGGGAA